MIVENGSPGIDPAYVTQYMHLGASQGWECPNCHHVYSPWQYECSRCPGDWGATISATETTK